MSEGRFPEYRGMPLHTAVLGFAAIAVSFLLLFFPAVLLAGELPAAGVAKVVHGQVTVAAGAEIRRLVRGGEVRSGDVVVTGPDSLAQIDFVDGSRVILRSGTRFRIREYSAREGSGRGVFDLLKGALRAVTGWIGHREKSVYRMRTALATIGIRGTDYELRYDPLDGGLWLGVTPGTDSEIVVENAAGRFILRAGEYGRIRGRGEPVFRLPFRPPELGRPPEICD